jgi:hypothetical protein
VAHGDPPAGQDRGRIGTAPRRRARRPPPVCFAASLAHGERKRFPSSEPTEAHERRCQQGGTQEISWLPTPDVAVFHEHESVGGRHHPFHPVLGHDDGDTEVVDQPGQGRNHVFRARGIQGGRRLVEHQDSGVHREHGADGHPLLLPAGEGPERARAQVGDAQEVQRLLHATAHGPRVDTQLLHTVCELVLDQVRDETCQRILAHVPHEVGEVSGRVVTDRVPVDDDVTVQRPAGEPWHQAVEHAQQR